MSATPKEQDNEAHQPVLPTDIIPPTGADKSAMARSLPGKMETEIDTTARIIDGQEDKEELNSKLDQLQLVNDIATVDALALPSSDCADEKAKEGVCTSADGCDIQGFEEDRHLEKQTGDIKLENTGDRPGAKLMTRSPTLLYLPVPSNLAADDGENAVLESTGAIKRKNKRQGDKSLPESPSLAYLASPSTMLPQYSSSYIDLSNMTREPQDKPSKWQSLKNKLSLKMPDSNTRDMPSGCEVEAKISKKDGAGGKPRWDVSKFMQWPRLKGARGGKETDGLEEGSEASSIEKAPRKFAGEWIQNLFRGKKNSVDEAVEEEEPFQLVDTYNTILDKKM